MYIRVNGEEYEVLIEKKRIKNTYIRVKDDLKVHVTCNYLSSTSSVERLIKDNIKAVERMINAQLKKQEKNEKFFYLGKEYNAVVIDSIKKVTIDDNYIYAKNKKAFQKFLDEEAKRVFPERLRVVHQKMNNNSIPYPNLGIKQMKRKWGYNKKSDNLVVLNKELIKYDIDDIDYVIVHELCHFLYFDHSKNFWNAVKLYKPNYKENKKHLKED